MGISLIFSLNKVSYAADLQLNFPVQCDHGRTCWILNYMDMSAGEDAAQDFTCGPRTQNGQQATDIAVRDLATASEGVGVLAAAPGIISRIVDGARDTGGTQSRLPCGNRVVIEHGDGWQTGYCHLKNGSLRVRPGQAVRAGQPIGEIGLSGSAGWPKLGFVVERYGTAIDPFSGRTAIEGCGLTPKSLWHNPQHYPYRGFAIYNLGFGIEPPRENVADQGIMPIARLPATSPSLSFWATVFDARKGDRVEMIVVDDRGNEIMAIQAVLQDNQKKRLVSMTRPRRGIWRAGLYTGTIRITRGGGQNRQISEWAAKVMITN